MKKIFYILILGLTCNSLYSQKLTIDRPDQPIGPGAGYISATIEPPYDFAPYEINWYKDGVLQKTCTFDQNDIDNNPPPYSCGLTGISAGEYCLEATATACDLDELAVIEKCFVIEGSSCNTTIDYFPTESIEPICLNETIDEITMGFSDIDDCFKKGVDVNVDYNWSNGDNTAYPKDLSPGEYCVTVTSRPENTCAGCFIVRCIEVPALNGDLNVSAAVTNACEGSVQVGNIVWKFRVNNGSITLNINGGSGGNSVEWFDDLSNSTIRTNLAPGTYCASIEDDCGDIIYECWEVGLDLNTECPLPGVPEGPPVAALSSSIPNNIINSWGNFQPNISINESWRLNLVESSELHVNYDLIREMNQGNYGFLNMEATENDDIEILQRASTNFYRNAQNSLVKVFPNPAMNVLNVSFDSDQAKESTIRMIDISGKIVLAEKVFADKGNNVHQVLTNNISGGIYFLTVEKESPVKVIIIKNK